MDTPSPPIRRIRALLGMSQATLGAALGMTQANVYHYEKRGQPVPPDVAQKLIEFAGTRGVPLSYDQIYGAAPLPEPAATGEA